MGKLERKFGKVNINDMPHAPVGIFRAALEAVKIDAERLANKLDKQLDAKSTKVLIVNGNVVREDVDDNSAQLEALKIAMKVHEFMPSEKLNINDKEPIVVNISPYRKKEERVEPEPE